MEIKVLQTSPELLDAIQKATTRKVAAGELLEQKISFVYSSVKAESGITREQVKRFIEQEPETRAAAG